MPCDREREQDTECMVISAVLYDGAMLTHSHIVNMDMDLNGLRTVEI